MAENRSWSREEVEAIVDDYLHMLTQELAGQSYNKTEHRRALSRKLGDRSDGSIERKHQNISAALLELGCPYISGYKPLPNYQALLFEVLKDRIAHNTLFDRAALSAVDMPAVAPLTPSFNRVLVDAPEITQKSELTRLPYFAGSRGFVRDYIDREARNRSLGEAGESFVVDYERARLHRLGKRRLSDRVEHVSRSKGDGLGYDVLSYEPDGRERFIEVKTTAFGKLTPFYISRNEVEFSKTFEPQYKLYRLFEFRKAPRMFELEGSVERRCLLDPISYVARFS
jgi:hypothetical protein